MRNTKGSTILGLAVLFVSAIASTPARAERTVERWAPYDRGCYGEPRPSGGCIHAETAMRGILDQRIGVAPTITYGPPFVNMQGAKSSTFLAVDVRTSRRGAFAATVSLRAVDQPHATAPRACAVLIEDYTPSPLGSVCTTLPRAAPATLEMRIADLPTGLYILAVVPRLDGLVYGAGAIHVDRILYTTA